MPRVPMEKLVQIVEYGRAPRQPLAAKTLMDRDISPLRVRRGSAADKSEWLRMRHALWPKPGVLVWAGGLDYWWWCDFCPLAINGGFMGGPAWYWPRYGGWDGGNGHLVAFDTTMPGAPQLAAQVDLEAMSQRAAAGFYSRAIVAKLRFEDGFLDAVAAHVRRMQRKAVA